MANSITKMIYNNDYRMSKKQRRRNEKEKEPADLRETLRDCEVKTREDQLANVVDMHLEQAAKKAKPNKAMERFDPCATFNNMSADRRPLSSKGWATLTLTLLIPRRPPLPTPMPWSCFRPEGLSRGRRWCPTRASWWAKTDDPCVNPPNSLEATSADP